MARLPQPGSDSGTWGAILNDYLLQSHSGDGTLKKNSVTTDSISNGSVGEEHLDSSLKSKINKTPNADEIDDVATTKKFVTAAEKSKLAGIATGATVNDTDANLKNRTNHTGTQAIATVNDLQSVLDSKIEKWNGFITRAPLYMHPESQQSVTIPYFMNDIAYNNLRGGSTTVYIDGIETATEMGTCFEPSSSFKGFVTNDMTEIVVVVNTWKTLQYGTKVGLGLYEPFVQNT